MIQTDVTKTNMHKVMNYDKVCAELATTRAENEKLREALLGVRDCWVRPRSGLTDFGEREHFANIVRMNISKAKEALK